jgi:membrane protein implicated in regulation of membrane protease activity
LLLGYIIIRFLITGVLLLPIWGLLFLIYAGVSIFFWYKAYSGEDVTIEYIDKFEEKVKENIK